jgi:Tfp pilus assembly protein PilO
MKGKSTNVTIVAMLAVAALAVAFWMLVLSPKREEAKKLEAKVEETKASLAGHRAEAAEALQARKQFPSNYQQLVVLGKAVPGSDETASLLLELNRIAKRAKVGFASFDLSSEGGGGGEEPAPETAPGSEPVTPTEAAASLLPLGATIGPAGLAVMPYDLTFDGNFFQIADFIHGLDSLVKTRNAKVSVTGRLITIGGFSLAAGSGGFPDLIADFHVTTYLTPPEQGVTAGATPAGPAPEAATPASTTTGGAP